VVIGQGNQFCKWQLGFPSAEASCQLRHLEPSSWQHYFCLALWHSCLISMIPSDNGDSNIKRHNRYICSSLSPVFFQIDSELCSSPVPFSTPCSLHFLPVALVDTFYAIHHLILLTLTHWIFNHEAVRKLNSRCCFARFNRFRGAFGPPQ